MKRKRPNDLFNLFENLMNSMGISPDVFFGDGMIENNTTQNGDWVTETIKLDNGMVIYKTYYTNDPNKKNVSEIDLLKSKLNNAIEKQEFEVAAELRDKIKNIENNKTKLNELNSKLQEAIKKEDFETAIVLRDEIKKMK